MKDGLLAFVARVYPNLIMEFYVKTKENGDIIINKRELNFKIKKYGITREFILMEQSR